MLQLRDKILEALEKDVSRRYIAISRLQADGRLELDRSCINILSPKDGETFYVIDDSSSIIIVRNPLPEHQNNIICETKFDEKRFRLRLNQRASRILLTCTLGIKTFIYNGDLALEAEPYIKPFKNLSELNLTSFDELAPFILRSSRSILHIDILNQKQSVRNDITFRILGEYWVERYHQKITDFNFNLLRCTFNNCEYCQNKLDFPIMKKILWFPIIGYENRSYPRPGLISFHVGDLNGVINVCADLIDKCERWAKYSNGVEQYHKHGIIDYKGENLYKIFSDQNGYVCIEDVSEQHPKYTNLSAEEKGLMYLALKELDSHIHTYQI